MVTPVCHTSVTGIKFPRAHTLLVLYFAILRIDLPQLSVSLVLRGFSAEHGTEITPPRPRRREDIRRKLDDVTSSSFDNRSEDVLVQRISLAASDGYR